MTTSAYDLAVNKGFKGTYEDWVTIVQSAPILDTNDGEAGLSLNETYQDVKDVTRDAEGKLTVDVDPEPTQYPRGQRPEIMNYDESPFIDDGQGELATEIDLPIHTQAMFHFTGISRIASEEVNPEHFADQGEFLIAGIQRFGGGDVRVDYRPLEEKDLIDATPVEHVHFEVTQSRQKSYWLSATLNEPTSTDEWLVKDAQFDERGHLIVNYQSTPVAEQVGTLSAVDANGAWAGPGLGATAAESVEPTQPELPDLSTIYTDPNGKNMLEELTRLKLNGALGDKIKETLNNILFTGKLSMEDTASELQRQVSEITSVETFVSTDHTEFKFAIVAQHPKLPEPTTMDIIYGRVDHHVTNDAEFEPAASEPDTGTAESEPREESQQPNPVDGSTSQS